MWLPQFLKSKVKSVIQRQETCLLGIVYAELLPKKVEHPSPSPRGSRHRSGWPAPGYWRAEFLQSAAHVLGKWPPNRMRAAQKSACAPHPRGCPQGIVSPPPPYQ